MRLLVVHQNFPGQFGHLVRNWMTRPGWEVRALGRDTCPGLAAFDGLTRYSLARQPRLQQHPYLRQMELATLHGQAAARAMLDLRRSGFVPDLVIAHPGWGETLYLKDVFPDARLIHLCEWYYDANGADLGFDPEHPATFDDRARIRTWNALHTLNLTQCDTGVTPTRWQLSRHPELFQPKIQVWHEGIPCHQLGPDAGACIRMPRGTVLKAGDPVITYVARNLEPYRGFHSFMRALAKVQQRDPRVQAVIVGGDDVSYGRRPPDAQHWREKMLREVKLDPTRTHFSGRVPYAQYVKLLQISAAHVYLSYPFVLSWSLLEAMACGAPVIASDTAPVREVIRDDFNGRLVGFFDVECIAQRVLEVCLDRSTRLRAAARATALRFSVESGIHGYDQVLKTAIHGNTVAPASALRTGTGGSTYPWPCHPISPRSADTVSGASGQLSTLD